MTKIENEVTETHLKLTNELDQKMETYNANLHLTVKKVDKANEVVNDLKLKF